MKKTFKNKKGFTLIESMITVALLGVVFTGIYTIYKNGADIWTWGSAKITLNNEANIVMMGVTKFIRSSQGSSLKITRYSPDQPVQSCLSGILAETAYSTVDTTEDTGSICGTGCGGSADIESVMEGDAGHEFIFFQLDNSLYYARPEPVTVPSTQSVPYISEPLSNNLDSINFAFRDSSKGRTVLITASFSKKPRINAEPVVLKINKSVSVKRFHSAGFYH